MTAEIFMAMGGTGIAAGVLGASILKSVKQSQFLYANARIAARTSYILTNEKLGTLSTSESLAQLISQLKDTEYSAYLDIIENDSITEFNMALEKSLIDSIINIKEITPKKFRKIYEIYTKTYEAKLIKTFFRSRFSDVKIDKNLLEPIGTINPVLLKHLEDTKTVADIRVVLRDTEYGGIFEKEYSSIEEFDLEIEKKVMDAIGKIVSKMKIDNKKAIMRIFDKRREIKNILTLIKFRIRKSDGIEPAKIIKIENLDIKSAMKSEDMKSFCEKFDKTEYKEMMKKAYAEHEKYGTFYAFERELLKHYQEFVRVDEIRYPIGPYPIISYITRKEFEQKNLLIIAKGITSQMEKDEIKRMLI
jgi:vacuolar-type H+-ATPase subunit C/Vma6